MQHQGSVRLNKFISESGLCSRREADRYIERGHVFINGRRASVGDQVNVGDKVRVNGHELSPRQRDDTVLIALNKPTGITSTTEEGIAENIVRFVNHSRRLFPIGRLDKDSQGLIFLTNDGDIVNKILRAGNKHEKEYLVTVNKPLTEAVIQGMAQGVPMLGVTTKKCKVSQEASQVFRIVLVQGLNRQIRRMCEHFGYDVMKLERVRIMNIRLKGIPLGEWRDLTPSEMESIFEMMEDSTSESFKKPSNVQPKVKSYTNPDERNKSSRPSSGVGPKRSSRKSKPANTGRPPKNTGRSGRSSSKRRG
jgi:23S rRNA pseudouridine2604 synthase